MPSSLRSGSAIPRHEQLAVGLALAFAGGSLAEAELGGMPLKGIDLRSTDIRGIRLTGGELKGAIVSPVQAMELARLLGVEIRE